ncbi:uncharacterized protein BN500_00550 [Clostridium sp. CAG:149]|nr:uncharacterized protein BN500_00550 [Clostridium sp. CAG:149]
MKRKIAALGGLAALAAVGGTWAYFNQTAAITNPFHTEGGYETSVIEHFNPADGQEWKPGVTVDKDVIASNTGDADVLVRVKMDEVWNRQVGGDMEVLNNFDSSQDEFLNPDQLDSTDGKVAGDKTVVEKEINNTDWTLKEDGYWYYNSLLAAHSSSEALLSSVTLLSDLDMGKYEDTFAYCTTADKDDPLTDVTWTEVASEEALMEAGQQAKEDGLAFHVKKGRSLDETAMGYADANYGLTITIEFVQPTEDAVKDAWGDAGYNYVKDMIPNA